MRSELVAEIDANHCPGVISTTDRRSTTVTRIAQRILAQARAEVIALEEANARLHNPPTIYTAGISQRSAFDLGERIVTTVPAEPSRLPGTVYEPHLSEDTKAQIRQIVRDFDRLNGGYGSQIEGIVWADAYEEAWDAAHDEDHPDPRWEANREVRFAVTSPGRAFDDFATGITGLPSVVEDEKPEQAIQPLRSWTEVIVTCHAALWAYLQATAISVRKARVFRVLVDKANCTVIAQSRRTGLPIGLHSIGYAPDAQQSTPLKPHKTVWRAGIATVPSAIAEAERLARNVRARGDLCEVITFAGVERKLLILSGTKVTFRPDRKGHQTQADEFNRYNSREEAMEAFNRIRAWATAQGIPYRTWIREAVTA